MRRTSERQKAKGCLLVLVLALGMGALFPTCRRTSPGTKPLTVGVVPMGTTHEFWKAIHAGAEQAARELGVRVLWKGPLKEDDRNEQVEIVETLVDARVDALVLTPIDDRALVRPVAEAKQAGIPTVIFNSALRSDDQVAYVSTDNTKGGVLAGEYMGGLLKGRGRVILVRVKAGVEGSTNREEGFLRTIRKKFPGIEILSDNQYAGVSTETAYQTVENLLNRFTGVEAIFTPNESTTFGCLRALEDHGLAGKIVHIGFDTSKKLLEALAERKIQGLIVQDPIRMGFESVGIAVAYLRGKPYPKYIDTGVFLATPDNMNEPRMKALLTPDLSILGR
jgi:ribose transport system substrate-binding protein